MTHVTRGVRRTGIVVALLLCAAAVPTAAQQAPDSTALGRTRTEETATLPAGPTRPGPRVAAPRFQRDAEPILSRSELSEASSALPASNHTITISTLTLVLVGIIVLLLVTS